MQKEQEKTRMPQKETGGLSSADVRRFSFTTSSLIKVTTGQIL
jgi:hypothetical protein